MLNNDSEGIKFLYNDKLHNEDYQNVKSNINEILNEYNINGADINKVGIATIVIEIKEGFPSSLISDLDNYMGMTSKISYNYSLRIIYNLNDIEIKKKVSE